MSTSDVDNVDIYFSIYISTTVIVYINISVVLLFHYFWDDSNILILSSEFKE